MIKGSYCYSTAYPKIVYIELVPKWRFSGVMPHAEQYRIILELNLLQKYVQYLFLLLLP